MSKYYCWIWVAVDRSGKRFINCALNSKGLKADELLWDKINDIEIGQIMTGHWKAYEGFV